MTKYYNEMEQSWRKLKQDHPDVAKAIEESDKREFMDQEDGTWVKDYDEYVEGEGFIYRAPIPEPVKLDTRRVAGWWCSDLGSEDGRLVVNVDLKNGNWLRMLGNGAMESRTFNSKYKFSKDPMKPLDQWQTLEEVCEEAER